VDVDRVRTGVLVVRAWLEGGAPSNLRVRVVMTDRGQTQSGAAAEVGDTCRIVRDWLDTLVLSADPQSSRPSGGRVDETFKVHLGDRDRHGGRDHSRSRRHMAGPVGISLRDGIRRSRGPIRVMRGCLAAVVAVLGLGGAYLVTSQ